MQKLDFSIFINAPREKVWDTMLEDTTYRQWTKSFNAGSYYEGSWEQGSEIKFLGVDEQGNSDWSGMYSRIKENRPHEFISIEHIGLIKDGVVDTTSAEVKQWTPAFENYTFTTAENGTELAVDIDVNDAFKAEFETMWPKALEALKALAEK